MIITVFAKKGQTKEGKIFYNYLARLKKKDGTELPVRVKFREECGNPKSDKCPCNIIVQRENMNLSSREYIKEDTGEVITSHELWVSAWDNGPEYVDHSMDDIAD